MGEPRSDDAERGRRHAHPDGTVPGAGAGAGAAGPALEVLLAAAIRGDAPGTEGERQAVAAFRTARDAGAHRARTRRRDDWRPREQRRVRRSVKATLTMALASLTLGGVAVAAIGSVHSSGHGHDDGRRPGSAPSAPGGSVGRPATDDPGTPGRTGPSGRPVTAQDTEAHCRAYEKVKDNGRAMDSTAWQRLIQAAGGETNVTAYCAELLSQTAANGKKTAKPGNTKKPVDTGNSGKGKSASGKGG
ncbi:hypothetical protein ACIPSJ_11220 [Streptomyces sp. NPDC090088]|uniref:hypothetical protein n=1 Tax=Streptomyces sp. NPDC090088 TaxID=3365944 RepID=UPI0038145309